MKYTFSGQLVILGQQNAHSLQGFMAEEGL